ncbi:MAG TPA: hypothetical protein VGR06_16105, partial [Actinophytocola sp.]|uniref:hypothetical protein n=1 Tax=Actinophytocola sp. TaxID=1872138 RepID=UPI002DFEC3CA|nr:hypothetical protein [Actinophytocola sp.]
QDGEAQAVGAGEGVGGRGGFVVPAPGWSGKAEVAVDLDGVGGQSCVGKEIDPGRVVAAVLVGLAEQGVGGGEGVSGGSAIAGPGVSAGLDELVEPENTRSGRVLGAFEGAVAHVDGVVVEVA